MIIDALREPFEEVEEVQLALINSDTGTGLYEWELTTFDAVEEPEGHGYERIIAPVHKPCSWGRCLATLSGPFEWNYDGPLVEIDRIAVATMDGSILYIVRTLERRTMGFKESGDLFGTRIGVQTYIFEDDIHIHL